MPPRRRPSRRRNVKRSSNRRVSRSSSSFGSRKKFTKRRRFTKRRITYPNKFTSNSIRASYTFGRPGVPHVSKTFQKKVFMSSVQPEIFTSISSFRALAYGATSEIVFFSINTVSDLEDIEQFISSSTPVKFALDHSSLLTNITSATNVPIRGRIYDLTLRRDIPNGQTPLSIFATGLSEVNTGGVYTKQSVNDLDVTLFDSGKFTSYFKIDSVKPFELDPGSSCPLNIHVSSKSINTEIVNESQTYALRGLTKFVALQFWGTNIQQALSANVTSGPVELSFIETRKFKFRNNTAAKVTYHSNTLPALTTLNMVNTDTGAADAAFVI